MRNFIRSIFVLGTSIAATLIHTDARAQQSSALIDTITIDNHHLNTTFLTPGLKQYTVYTYNSKSPKAVRPAIWTREVAKTTLTNEPVFTVSQQWFFSDTNYYRNIYSVNRATDFAPIYHRETIGSVTKAYEWSGNSVTASAKDTGNAAKDFKKDLATKAFNWNLDIETFEQLPFAAGKTFVFYFYDAGYGEPTYTTYTVEGSEELALVDNKTIDCWILVTTGKMPKGDTFTQKFWVSKKGHEFLREVDNFGDTYRVKLKMLGAAPVLNPGAVKP